MNRFGDWFVDFCVPFLFAVILIGAVGAGLLAGAEYLFWGRPSQPAIIACEARGMGADRPDFSRLVTCLPRYRGADSLHITGVR